MKKILFFFGIVMKSSMIIDTFMFRYMYVLYIHVQYLPIYIMSLYIFMVIGCLAQNTYSFYFNF